MRSFVAEHVMLVVRGWGESHPDPIAYFFSALPIKWRRIFSAFGVRVLACISKMPQGFGFGEMGVAGEDIEGLYGFGGGVGTT
jgi:hypothetical protein